MKKAIETFCILVLISWILLSVGAGTLTAKEDSARLYFKKTAAGAQKGGSYVVKRGDCLYRILQRQRGNLSYAQQQELIRRITQLNPDIENPDVIYAGQTLILPEALKAGASIPDIPTVTYTAKRGDSLTKIALRELNVQPQDVYKTVQVIGQLNPEIEDLDMIYAGQALKLPAETTDGSDLEQASAGSPGTAVEETKLERRARRDVLPESCLAAIGHIIGRIGGYMITTGNHYIPLTRSGQINIDCSAVPVIELDDGSMILLNVNNQIPVTIKKMIEADWKNYFIVNAGLNEGIDQILQRAINASPSYGMSKAIKPIALGTKPEIQLFLDWLITRKKAAGQRDDVQGLSFLNDRSQILPPPMTDYAERNGLGITEVLDGCSIVSKPEAGASALDVPALNTTSGKDMVQALLMMLGYTTTRNEDVRIFDRGKDGFNLTIKADLLVTAGDRRLLFHWTKLPSQFVDILKKDGIEVVLIDEKESNRTVVEKTLQALNISFDFNRYTYSLPEGGEHARGVISFPALRIERETKPLYLVEFDMDRNIYGLLHNRWEVNVLRY